MVGGEHFGVRMNIGNVIMLNYVFSIGFAEIDRRKSGKFIKPVPKKCHLYISVNEWYLYKMAAQRVVRTCGVKSAI